MNPCVMFRSDTSNALQSLVFAAKLCYGKEQDSLSGVEQERLIAQILTARHFSILEHAVLSFYITGISRNCTHQLVRHRHMSFAQQSLHYTIANNESIAIGKVIKTDCAEIMQIHAKRSFEVYKCLIEKGVPREEARHILPSGIATKILCTANLREWVHFVGIRSCMVNCEEIKNVALQVQELLTNAFPWLREYLGPACLTDGKCHEGRKSCGHSWLKLEVSNEK